jgi:hypothetical protein
VYVGLLGIAGIAAGGIIVVVVAARWVVSTVRDIYESGRKAGYQEAMRDVIADHMVREQEAARSNRASAWGDTVIGRSDMPAHLDRAN